MKILTLKRPLKKPWGVPVGDLEPLSSKFSLYGFARGAGSCGRLSSARWPHMDLCHRGCCRSGMGEGGLSSWFCGFPLSSCSCSSGDFLRHSSVPLQVAVTREFCQSPSQLPRKYNTLSSSFLSSWTVTQLDPRG